MTTTHTREEAALKSLLDQLEERTRQHERDFSELKAYRNTGLTPEQVCEIKARPGYAMQDRLLRQAESNIARLEGLLVAERETTDAQARSYKLSERERDDLKARLVETSESLENAINNYVRQGEVLDKDRERMAAAERERDELKVRLDEARELYQKHVKDMAEVELRVSGLVDEVCGALPTMPILDCMAKLEQFARQSHVSLTTSESARDQAVKELDEARAMLTIAAELADYADRERSKHRILGRECTRHSFDNGRHYGQADAYEDMCERMTMFCVGQPDFTPTEPPLPRKPCQPFVLGEPDCKPILDALPVVQVAAAEAKVEAAEARAECLSAIEARALLQQGIRVADRDGDEYRAKDGYFEIHEGGWHAFEVSKYYEPFTIIKEPTP